MNKTSYGILILILITTITYFSAGCNKKDDTPSPVQFTIKVDSIHHADTIHVGETFDIDCFGKVGDNDCYEFQEIKDTINTGTITLELIGKHTFRENCAGGIIYMSPATARISGLTAGDWTITINQPEGVTPIESKVFVE
jgi:hypothetical protein